MRIRAISALLLASGALTTASAQPSQTRREATSIVTQPVRDIGLDGKNLPAVLVAARQDPYSLKGLNTCAQIYAAANALTAVLGPDFVVGNEKKENRAGKIAAAGGKTIVNTVIPFRGLVRELSGAAPAQRRLEAAMDAGYARRGFLRGVHFARKCRAPV